MAEDARYERLLEAARDAARGGYDAVTMRDLAATAGMSLRTIYGYCGSKDHLIAEAHADWIRSFQHRLAATPPAGATPVDRVAAVMRQMGRSLARNAELTRAILRALQSNEPAVVETRDAVRHTYAAIIDAAIGDDDIQDRRAAIDVLGHVINSVMAQWAAGTLTAAHAGDELERAARLVIRPSGQI